MKNNAWRTFFIGIFFCLMIGLAFGACGGGFPGGNRESQYYADPYDHYDEEYYEKEYPDGPPQQYDEYEDRERW